MCLPSAPKAPKPTAPPPAPNQAPDEIENAVDSNATQLNKNRMGKKKLRRGAGMQVASSSQGSGLTINK
tara:strand:+ start:14303 stop:14509 length:207 start_codon:yes stop_codon:yes gene_type:complete